MNVRNRIVLAMAAPGRAEPKQGLISSRKPVIQDSSARKILSRSAPTGHGQTRKYQARPFSARSGRLPDAQPEAM